MFSSTLSPSSVGGCDPNAYDLTEEYGSDASAKLSTILQALDLAGFPKAHVNSYSAFDRILSGITWLFQQMVRREDAEKGRVQWNVLFQSHDTMKPRLGLAQEVVRCIEALPYVCPVAIQPHQLLLQDYGDIETVQKLVLWLIDESREVRHLEKSRRERAFVQVRSVQEKKKQGGPLSKEIELLLEAYAPKRRWRYVAASDEHEDSEDALIQRCLLEYGEKIASAVEEDEEGGTQHVQEEHQSKVDLMAQLANQAAAIAGSGVSTTRKESRKGLRRRKKSETTATEFERQYQEVMKQAKEEQQVLLNERRKREAKLLPRVVLVPEEEQENNMKGRARAKDLPVYSVKQEVKKHEQQVQDLIQQKKDLDMKRKECQARASALDEALAAVKAETKQVEEQLPKDADAQAQVGMLRQLLEKKKELKQEKKKLGRMWGLELKTLEEQIEKLKGEGEMTFDTKNENNQVLRLNEIEQVHSQMAQKCNELKRVAAKQTRAVHLKLKELDAIPSRMEMVQYEKRFVELYDEVALTLDETRKYFCRYNTLKTTLEFVEKEISLIQSIHENVDTAMSCKSGIDAFFRQMEQIIQNMQGLITKEQRARDEYQVKMEPLESTYQMLLDHERQYVNAIREFQFECEKNEKLTARLEERRQEETRSIV